MGVGMVIYGLSTKEFNQIRSEGTHIHNSDFLKYDLEHPISGCRH